ncbi:MAG: SDR family NAD(P)-dependent oxidoreductase [Bacteroidota bacterium]
MTVFITGASAGIGAATARAFASGGHRVLLAARSADTLAALARDLNTEHGPDTALAVPLDVSDADAHDRALADLPADWREVDVAVLNAGLAKNLAPVWENTVSEVDQMVDVNIKGVLNGIRAMVPGMLARARGHVVLLGSTAGHFVYPGGTVYCATKHAVRALALGLKQDLHATPVRVSLVSPGLVETDFSLVRFSGDAARADAVYADTVALTPEDVAEAVVWATTQPSRVNVQEVLVTPRVQAAGGALARGEEVVRDGA